MKPIETLFWLGTAGCAVYDGQYYCKECG